MKVVNYTFSVRSSSGLELINITGEVRRAVRESGVKSGICLVYTTHTTAAIVINEDEPGLREDVARTVRELFKPGGGWKHDLVDSNAHAHLSSIYLGPAKVVPVVDGDLLLGTWQSIFFVELDGPRSRRYHVTVMGD
ncbi:hypothetical protein B6U99_00975 [Candidatus Geothermarchaeota archaeon ex4572_27]|nr:MAG: hypothetical protein B6U99_00975 [Candidatus Geothermarchaeota archaeon ex4572_27]